MISQLYVLSPRGDNIINRDFRGDVAKGTAEIFFRKVKFWGGDAPPIFNLDGVNYIFIRRCGLYFVATTVYNVSPSYVVELLQRMAKVFKDFCGILTEESIRKNFVLVYELLDEMLDFGYPQSSNIETLKSCIHNEAVAVDTTARLTSMSFATGFPHLAPKTISSNAAQRPVGSVSREGQALRTQRKNEIFVDILEKLTLVLSSDGYILNSFIDGSIQMKSYLTGSPELQLALNENIGVVTDRSKMSSDVGLVLLDDYNFHECVNLSQFDESKLLSLTPPAGEFTVMNYRITGEFKPPFRIIPTIDQISPLKLELLVKIRADISEQSYGSNVTVWCPLPKHTISASIDVLPTTAIQSADFVASEGRLVWNIKKFMGGREHALKCRIALSQPLTAPIKKETGPISMAFEIPMHNVSNIQVRYLRINESHPSYNPFRWVRYVTQSASYVCRL